MKIALGVFGLFLLIILIVTDFAGEAAYKNRYAQYWELADRSSTIQAKQQNIEKFVTALEEGYKRGNFSRFNAVIYKTPDLSFEFNLDALKSLATRLNEIQGMNPSSFEYNTAIQQITAQEQGEASKMLDVFKGAWFLGSYWICWYWIGGTLVVLSLVLIVVGIVGLAAKYNWNLA